MSGDEVTAFGVTGAALQTEMTEIYREVGIDHDVVTPFPKFSFVQQDALRFFGFRPIFVPSRLLMTGVFEVPFLGNSDFETFEGDYPGYWLAVEMLRRPATIHEEYPDDIIARALDLDSRFNRHWRLWGRWRRSGIPCRVARVLELPNSLVRPPYVEEMSLIIQLFARARSRLGEEVVRAFEPSVPERCEDRLRISRPFNERQCALAGSKDIVYFTDSDKQRIDFRLVVELGHIRARTRFPRAKVPVRP